MTDLSQCGATRDQERRQTLNGVQVCSVLHVAHVCVLVLVGVGRVTVVHIGHEDVVVVIYFYVAIFVVIFGIRRCTLYICCTICYWDMNSSPFCDINTSFAFILRG